MCRVQREKTWHSGRRRCILWPCQGQNGNPGLQALKRAGFFVHHSRGSHHYLKHPNNPSLRVTVALHNRDLKRRTLETIIKQAGLTPDEFRRLLSRL